MKNRNIVCQVIIIAVILTAFTPNQETNGKEIFEKKCAKCHGKDGTKRLFGAKKLQESILTSAETLEIITNGKGKMPSWKENLTTEQINEVATYIATLRVKK